MTRTERAQGGLRRWMGFALIAVMALGAMAGGAAAHTDDDDHGDLTLHDSRDGEAQRANATATEPVQLHCDFWVKGHNMTHQNGTLKAVKSSGPTVEVTTLGSFNGTPNGSGGYDFVAGPFTLDETGEYHISADMGEEDERGVPPHGHPGHNADYTACEQEDERSDDQAQPPACPENLTANAQNDESIALAWDASDDADSYHVYRATEDGAFEHVAEVNDTAYTDTGTEADITYRYEVTAANGAGEAEDCATVEVTAIPFFGSPAIVAMAAVGSVGAVAALRVRRG